MSRTFHHGRHQKKDRQVYVRALRRDPEDYRRIARALIAIARAQAETDAKAAGTRPPRARSQSKARSPEGEAE